MNKATTKPAVVPTVYSLRAALGSLVMLALFVAGQPDRLASAGRCDVAVRIGFHILLGQGVGHQYAVAAALANETVHGVEAEGGRTL